jgi:succinate dehydrogenase / fumarate reductase cytochrome b subunit
MSTTRPRPARTRPRRTSGGAGSRGLRPDPLPRAGRRAGRRPGRLAGWAFILNRATGIGLVVYLYVHLAVLSLLAVGPGAYDEFVRVAGHPLAKAFDVLLVAGLVVHGFNGIRVALVGTGLGVSRQRPLFAALMLAGGLVVLVAAIRIFG